MKSFVISISLVVFCASMLNAQSADAIMSGYVSDASGSAVPNAKVVLTNPEYGRFSQHGNKRRRFVRLQLPFPAQAYELSVTAAGFQREVHPEIRVEAAQIVRTDFTLQVGQTQQEATGQSD